MAKCVAEDVTWVMPALTSGRLLTWSPAASKLGHGSLNGWPPRAVQAGWWGSEGSDKVSYSAQRPVERGVAPGTGDGGKKGRG